jgi:alkylation response protein AidB-like acyl-CoA dehydrogenase
MTFILNDVLKAPERTQQIPEYADSAWEMAEMMIGAASDYATKFAFPLNKSGDAEGCHFDPATKTVTTPKGFKQAYDALCDSGMVGLMGDVNFGGAGQPHYIGAAVNEIFTSANFSLATYAGLTAGAAKVLEHFAPEEIKALYLPKMYTGEWTGTMCLTEPGAGSDLGAVSSKAEKNADGSYKVNGNKIFITCGEHDMSGNICHLVLARLPGAPEGTRGISLFLVPKLAVDSAGNTGEKNGVTCTGIEHKMGINGSATCSLSFEDAKGYLIGKENEGLKAMFTMMNDARQNVALQGLSLSEVVYQNTAEYAALRVQGKNLKDSFNPAAKATAIINHANVRRELVEMKAQIEGFRALSYETSIMLDIAEKHPDAATRKVAEEYTALMTPVLKANLTDLSCSASQTGVQLHGGMGYIRETGIEQYYRDSLIGTIYEGTNDIQAIDFTFRKVLANPASVMALGQQLGAEIAAAKANPALAECAGIVEKSLGSFVVTAQTLGGLAAAAKQDPSKLDDVLIHTRDFMNLFGKIAVGGMWLKMMAAAEAKGAAEPSWKEYCDERKLLGECFIRRIMAPEVKRLEMRIRSDVASVKKTKFGGLIP